jgi:hypothetical protein
VRWPWRSGTKGGGGGNAGSSEEGRKGRGRGLVGHSGPKGQMVLGRLGRKLKENSFLNKNWIFEYTKALEICRRRFRWNFDMKFFPKFI